MTTDTVTPIELPPVSLLGRYESANDPPAYTDAFVVSVPIHCSMADYVQAFYSSWLFRLERFILARAGFPSSDQQLASLARREARDFAAWTVEARTHNQLLLCDAHSRTRSWLMLIGGESQTTLYFGSAVIGRGGQPSASIPWAYRALMPFHRWYSRALLANAKRLLLNGHRRT